METINPFQKVKVRLNDEGVLIAKEFHNTIYNCAPEGFKLEAFRYESQLDEEGFYKTTLQDFYLMFSDYAKRYVKLPISSAIYTIE